MFSNILSNVRKPREPLTGLSVGYSCWLERLPWLLVLPLLSSEASKKLMSAPARRLTGATHTGQKDHPNHALRLPKAQQDGRPGHGRQPFFCRALIGLCWTKTRYNQVLFHFTTPERVQQIASP